jgi:hypothetical protein
MEARSTRRDGGGTASVGRSERVGGKALDLSKLRTPEKTCLHPPSLSREA